MKIIGRIPPILLYSLISLSTMTETICSIALPEIAERFGTNGGVAQLSTTAYFIGFAIGILTLGRISDIYGRKPIVMFGLVIYGCVSFAITFCDNIENFIILRFFQAYGASIGSVIAQAMARDSYKGWELSYIYASVAMVMAVVPTTGSVIGGYIIQYYDWQTSFYFLTVIAVSLLLVHLTFLPETNPNIGTARLNRFFSVIKVALSDKVLLSYAFMVGSFNGICFGFYIQAPFIFIDKLKMNPSDYGNLFLILTSANLIGGLGSRYLIKRFYSTFKIKLFGMFFSILGAMLLMLGSLILNEYSTINYYILGVFIPMLIHLVGHSLVVPMLLRHALEDYHKVTGTAGSIFGSLYYFVTAGIILLISSFHSRDIQNFAKLFFILMLINSALFACTTVWRKKSKKFEFI